MNNDTTYFGTIANPALGIKSNDEETKQGFLKPASKLLFKVALAMIALPTNGSTFIATTPCVKKQNYNTLQLCQVRPFSYRRSPNFGLDDELESEDDLDTKGLSSINFYEIDETINHNKINEAFKSLTSSKIYKTNSDLIKPLLGKFEDKLKSLDFPIAKITASCTPNDSLFYQLSFENSSLEFRIEQYLEYDENDRFDIELNMSIYKKGIKLISYGDSMGNIFAIINNGISAGNYGRNC